MSQKDDASNDLSEIKKNASNNLLNIQQQQFPSSQPLLQEQQQQQQSSASNSHLGNAFTNQMPLPYYNNWDWYNYYSTAAMPGPINPSPFDIGYKDEFKNYQAPFQQQQAKHLKKQKSSINLTSISSSNINTASSSALGGINNLKSTSLSQINDIKSHSNINNLNNNNINNYNNTSINKDNKKLPQVVTSSSSKNKSNISTANSRSSSVNSRAESHHSWASRDSLNDTNYQMYNQAPFAPSSASTTSNQKQNAPNKQQYSNSQQQQYTNPYSLPPMPFMDPSSYMYYQMAAAAAAYGYPPLPYNPYNPYAGVYGSGAVGGSAMSMVNLTQRQLQDDQQSIQSFHNFDIDTRSERKVNFNTTGQVNKAQSIAGGNMFNIKSEPKPSSFMNSNNNNLLMEDNFQNLDNNNGTSSINGLIETNTTIQNILVKRDENRLTPQMHQLPHVRACFSINTLVQIRANDPCEGQPALVDLINLGDMMEHYLLNLKTLSSNNNNKKLSISLTDHQDNLNTNDDDESAISFETRSEILINYKLLQEFPGPLVRENNTSKAQVIQFCQKNVKECLSNTNINLIDPQSHALLWDYLALLVRQNGIVDLKTDISSLLLNGIGSNDTHNQWSLTNSSNNNLTPGSNNNQANTKAVESISSASSEKSQDFVLVNNDDTTITNSNINDSKTPTNSSTTIPSSNNGKTQPSKPICEEELHLNKLRQLLGAGQKSDAIELAIKYNMWPHALFLASSINSSSTSTSVLSNSMSLMSIANNNSNNNNNNNMLVNTNLQDAKALNKVKLRFISSLQANDPIHTCYQLLIGRVPAIATNLPKTEWNDWRRHLAMIVSNVDDSNKDLVMTTIKTMGDSLAFNGRVAASHFCYLLSNCQFGSFNKKSSKLVLIGSSHNQDYNKFCQTSAIQATEIYEFATALSNIKNMNSTSGFLDHFVRYKLIYASRLLEHGLFNEACKYIEVIAKTVNLNPKLHSDKISSVYQLANRLRIYDSDFNLDDLMNNSSNLGVNEPLWLQELTNNFKKINLNKVWHLLPSNNNTIKDDNELKQAEKPIVNLNIEPKLEPKPAEISSSLPLGAPTASNNNINVIQINHSNNSNLSIGSNLQSNSNANIDINTNLQSHQSMPFVPSTPQINHVDPIQQKQPNWESQQLFQDPHTSNPYRRASASSTHSMQYQQPQQQLHTSQFQTNNQYDPSNQITPSFTKNQFNFPPNSNLNATNTSQLQSNFYQPGQTPSNRSRQSSVSVSNNDISNSQNQTSFVPFNPYQPQQQIYKSQTFPVHQDSTNTVNNNLINNSTSQFQPSAFNSQLNLNSSEGYLDPQNKHQSQTNNHLRKSKKSEEEEGDDEDEQTGKNTKTTKKEEDKKALNTSQVTNQEGGLLKRFVNYIRPPNSAKAMVLPDDKNKSIVWDEKLKRYVNKDAKEDSMEKIKPPPTFLPPQGTPISAQSLPQQQNQSTLNSLSNDVSVSNATGISTNLPAENRFSLKSQNLSRRSYYSKVDVLSSQTKKLTDQGMQQSASLLSNMPPPSQIPPRFFVPEPTVPQDQLQEIDQQQHHQNQENIQESNNVGNNQPEQSFYNPINNLQYQQPQNNNAYYSPQIYQQPNIQNYQQLNDLNNYLDENDSATTTNSNSVESYNGGMGAGGSQTTSSSNDSSNYYKQQNYGNNYNQSNDQYNNYTSNI